MSTLPTSAEVAAVAHVAPYKNKAHRSAFAAGWKAARSGDSRVSPYIAADGRTSLYFHRAWIAGFDSAALALIVGAK